MQKSEYDELDPICLPFVDGGPAFGDVITGKPAAAEKVPDGGLIPYRSVYTPSVGGPVFIPGQPIRVHITKFERSIANDLLNPYLYTVDLEHGPFVWTIHKRYKHFLSLHDELKELRASLSIPFPTLNQKDQGQCFKNIHQNITVLPRFPTKPDVIVNYDEVEDRARELEQYLQVLLNIPFYRNHHVTTKFLSASHLSFVNELGMKGLEDIVQKKTGSTQRGGCCGLLDCVSRTRFGQSTCDLFGCYRERWLVVKDTWIGYIRPKDSLLLGVILFDQGFDATPSLHRSSIQVYNMQRRIVFKCRGRRKRSDLCEYIKSVSQKQGLGFTQRNLNSSFAPPRTDTVASWFVDGSSYMSAVADAIMKAKDEIFIADWWLSPEIYLKRPSNYDHQWRLDCLLEKKANEGVKIFVLLYKEVERAMGINSYYSKSRLANLHKTNIKVLRHPDHANSGVFLWAHHEKIVCIDQTYAFIGGIDLCYGRWDDAEHRLVDCGGDVPASDKPDLGIRITSNRPMGTEPRPLNTLVKKTKIIGLYTMGDVYLPGGESSAVVGEENTAEQIEELQLKPWQVPADHEKQKENPEEKIKCDSPEFKKKNIFQKWQDSAAATFIMKVTGESKVESKENEIDKKAEVKEVEPSENLRLCADEFDSSLRNKVKFWVGKDYCNFIVKDFCKLDSPDQDMVDRNTTPRMPWHDVGMMVHGAAARDVARHFIQRWNATKVQKVKKVDCYPYLVPKSYQSFEEPEIFGNTAQFRVNCQVLRSVSTWSAGFLEPNVWEESIQEAYVNSISQAQHYIYIENQFFISLAKPNRHVTNQVCSALFRRILKAHREKKTFRVFVVLPLLPGFEGEVGGASGTALHAITHWNYASICRGPDSLIACLEAEGISNPFDYVSFHGLRNHSILHGEPVTELIYVHSKLMIVDDRLVICGSANINDRSLAGIRDSEIAAIIQDEEFVDGAMNGKITSVGVYASSLRKHIFSEHLGYLSSNSMDIVDPISDAFFHNTWKATSESNTSIYEEVFHCLPSDDVTSFEGLPYYQKKKSLLITKPSLAATKIASIKGHLVDLPLDFLKDEILTPNQTKIEGYMPTSLWT